jgi:hypothetical protein
LERVSDNIAAAFAVFAKGYAIDYSIRAQSLDACEIDVTGCRNSRFFEELGSRSWASCWCAAWTSRSRGLGADVTRSQTIMQGAATAISATGGGKGERRSRTWPSCTISSPTPLGSCAVGGSGARWYSNPRDEVEPADHAREDERMATQRNDPTFPIFVVLAAIFIFAVMYLTYPSPGH